MNWRILQDRFEKGDAVPGISLDALPYYGTVMTPLYRVHEIIGSYEFDMLRLQVSKRKITIKDDLGLVGVSSLDLNVNKCYLTEGVSDFIATKLILKNKIRTSQRFDYACNNVLGVTKLSGNNTAKELLIGLFDEFVIITDNDNTGISNVSNFRQFLMSNGKKVEIMLPEAGNKDICQQYCKILGNKIK